MLNKIIIVCLFLASCASTNSADWGPWKIKDVATHEREWDFCRKDKFGELYDGKGFCYASMECRTRRTILGNTREECRPKLLHCPWGDVNCLIEYDIYNSVIVKKEKLR